MQENATTTTDGTSRDCVTVELEYGSSAGEQSWIDTDDPLNIIVTDLCDDIGEFVGGCPEYQDWEYE
ncbi:hypothetical protein [Halobacterium yunchengense]|uniref:hypothetical protein n=1 Tax=Halobacterium yunchengense TaxID=3108497 RepID=UPI00300A6788